MLGAATADEQWKVAKTAMEEIDHFRKMNRLLQEIGFDATDRFSFRIPIVMWMRFAGKCRRGPIGRCSDF